MAKEIAEEYTSSLADLTLNSKPLINMLTMLAEDNIQHAEHIVEAVEKHLEKVRSEFKLPVLYLIDSIVKNVGQAYTQLFTQNIVNTFCSVFEKVDEKVRAQMFKLRQTWSEVFPPKKLYTLDVRVQCIDPAWPITALPPTPNIHVNPRFFSKPNAKNAAATIPVVTTPAITTPAAAAKNTPVPNINVPIALDPKMLDMQSQVINKQKELLELRQKKLELELLQAKAKLEEQQKALEKQTVNVKTPQQLLLKPEVAKQLAQTNPLSGVKIEETNKTSHMLKGVTQTGNVTGARIAPVNSALVATVRPGIRDPRLAGKPVPSGTLPAPQNTLPIHSNNSIIVENNYKVKNSSKSHNISSDIVSTDSKLTTFNKVNTHSGALNRKDPRLHSKIQGPVNFRGKATNQSRNLQFASTGKTNNNNPTSPPSSPKKSPKSPNKSQPRSFNKGVKTTSRSSAKNSKNNTAEPSAKSPIKHKKKSENTSPHKSEKRSKRSKSEKRSRDRSSGDKYDSDKDSVNISPVVNTTPVIVASPVTPDRTFKDLKGSTKNRNYIRRNRAISVSPELQHDVDLRVGAPPEKLPRLQANSAMVEDTTTKNSAEDSPGSKDVDLRTLVVPAPIAKKRLSAENLESSPAKKSKTEIFDVLFGNEDVDLRQLPLSQPIVVPSEPVPTTTQSTIDSPRPPTPPPPIISMPRMEQSERKPKEKTTDPHFEALRAKLANATKMSEKESAPAEDTDMRVKPPLFGTDDLTKIIISQADEQSIKTGNLSQELVEKVLTIFETQKLKEAQRRESEKSTDFNISLTPISDDELSADFSHSSESDDEKKEKKERSPKKRRERIPPPAPIISLKDDPKEIYDRNSKHINESSGMWHGHRRRRPRIWNNPPVTGVPEPWIRPPPGINPQMFQPRRPFPGFMHPPGNFRMEMTTPIQDMNIRTNSPSLEPLSNGELPNADPLVLEYIEKDTMRTINIDGKPREIRYYDETAVVIMSWDDPREISFQNGTRIVTFDDKESFTLAFNDEHKTVTFNGVEHQIKLGAPTRELYIDDKWYECFFGGPGIGIEIDGKMHVVKMDGPPPHVKIGNVKRTDLVAGKINLIINARQMVPVFLDAKPQKFDIEGKLHTLRFIDSLRTVLINEQPFKVEFGGLPKPITVHDKKHFIRFSVLPRDIRPGYINIHKMEGEKVLIDNENGESSENTVESVPAPNEPALPMIGKRKSQNDLEGSPENNRQSPVQQIGQFGSLDVLSSIITSPMAAASNNGYQIDIDSNTQDSQESFPIITRAPNDNTIPGLSQDNAPPAVHPLGFIPTGLNINELFQKLIATGIVTSVKENSPQPQRIEDNVNLGTKPVLFTQPETLKIRQPMLVANLFSGLQCSSCGVRFPPECSMQYSQHLDWHFRQNRRGRSSTRNALCRKWYYNVDDWKNFEEIEDLEDREKNWFESQQQQQQTENQNEEHEEEIEPSVPASSSKSERCEVCHDKFDQFYNEEKEEWHLRRAIIVEEKTYHPACYDDFQTSVAEASNITQTETYTSEIEPQITNSEEPETDTKEESKSDDDVVEVKDDEVKDEEIQDDGDDDVQILTETVEEIVIDDNDDTDESKLEDSKTDMDTTMELPTDEDMAVVLRNLKSEPMDGDELPIVPISTSQADNTQAELVSSIDGNVQFEAGPTLASSGLGTKIKINITKPIHPIPPKEVQPELKEPESLPIIEPPLDCDEPLPPGEEPIQLNLKPALQGLKLTKQSTVMKGTELTGMCSIM